MLQPYEPELRTERAVRACPVLHKLRRGSLGKRDAVARLAFRCLLEQFEVMLREEPKAWKGTNPEGVHQMRVATRRIRAALRAFKRVLPTGDRKQFSLEFKWLARVLGDVRDLDVYWNKFQDQLGLIAPGDAAGLGPYLVHLEKQRQEARNELRSCLAGQRYQPLCERFTEFLRRGAAADVEQSSRALTISGFAARCIGKQYARVLREGRSISLASPEDQLHELRIDSKRLRYLFEFYRVVYGKSLTPFVKRLKKLQDLLGELQDARVARARLGEYADHVPMQTENRSQLLALGQLIANQDRQSAVARRRLDKVWKRFDRPGVRNRILKVLKSKH